LGEKLYEMAYKGPKFQQNGPPHD